MGENVPESLVHFAFIPLNFPLECSEVTERDCGLLIHYLCGNGILGGGDGVSVCVGVWGGGVSLCMCVFYYSG